MVIRNEGWISKSPGVVFGGVIDVKYHVATLDKWCPGVMVDSVLFLGILRVGNVNQHHCRRNCCGCAGFFWGEHGFLDSHARAQCPEDLAVPADGRQVGYYNRPVRFVFFCYDGFMLYTRKGDTGTTKTLNKKPSERVSKASCQTEALGVLDELNSFLGLCKVKAESLAWRVDGKIAFEIIGDVQQNLFIIQAETAGAKGKTIKPSKVGEIEIMADEMENLMPPIKSFFVSGGSEQAALFDVARTLTRRAERAAISAIESGEISIGEHTRAYLNRLSSLFFALARFTNFKAGVKEESPRYE